MDALFESGLEAVRWLQSTYPQLTDFFIFLTTLGSPYVYFATVPLIYWSINKKFGKYLLYLLAWSTLSFNVLKHLLHQPRPLWLDPSVGLAEAENYGLPSGHAQSALVFYTFIASWFNRTWLWVLALLIIFLMGLSRVYLGVHFVHDVLAGYLVGAVIMGVYWGFRYQFQERFRNQILGRRLLAVLIAPLVLASVYGLLRWLIGAPDETVAWVELQAIAERADMENVATGLGGLLGMGIGIMLEASRVHFIVEGLIWKRVARVVVGFAGAAVIWLGLDAVFPADPLWLALPLRVVQYGLLGMWLTFYAPAGFVRLGLADATPEPEVSLSVSEGSIMRG